MPNAAEVKGLLFNFINDEKEHLNLIGGIVGLHVEEQLTLGCWSD